MRRCYRLALALLTAPWAGEVLAYRPFDGTDAAVAEPGLVEIELGPAQYEQVGPNRTLFAPNVIFNYGLADRWELVLQGGLARGLEPDASGVALTGNQLLLKGVLREGRCRKSPAPASPLNSASCCPTSAQPIRAAPAAWRLSSSRSAGLRSRPMSTPRWR